MADYPDLTLPDTTIPDALRACIDALRVGQRHIATHAPRRALEDAACRAETVLNGLAPP